jgi:hypothetical protein
MVKRVDWVPIEREIRAGQLSNREIARQYDISETAIRKRIKSRGIKRDLSKRVREEVRTKLVRGDVRTDNANTDSVSDDQIVDEASDRALSIVRSHRKSILSGRVIANQLSDQLSLVADNREAIEQAIIDDTPPDENGKIDIKRRNAMLKAVSLPAHAGVLRDLSVVLKNIIPLERQAFNIDETADSDGPDAVLISYRKKDQDDEK